MVVKGKIPAYCAGVLYRNGLGPRDVRAKDGKKTVYRTNHWFDNLSQVHRFQIIANSNDHVRVIHNSRLTCDNLVKQIQHDGKGPGVTFGAKYEPCMTFFQKLQALFRPALESQDREVSVGVTLSTNFPGIGPTGEAQHQNHAPGLQTLLNKTDASVVQSLDPETLEPIGIAQQSVLDPLLTGPLSAAHAKVCSKTGDVYNYNLDFSKGSGVYRVFHVSASSGKTTILTKITDAPAYIHSMFLTDHYLILCVWNAHFAAGGIKFLWEKNFVDALSNFDVNKTAKFFVIDRTPGKGLVATFESDAFFCFHTINAWEQADPNDATKTDVIADMCAYENLDSLKRFYMDNMLSNSAKAKDWTFQARKNSRPHFRRFKLGDVARNGVKPSQVQKAEVLIREETGVAPELPAMNPRFKGRKYRYSYGVVETGKSTFFDGLIKYDADSEKIVGEWSNFAQTAGEPIFVADPNAGNGDDDEEKGVLLTVVLDGTRGNSYLLVLDAKTMEEVGRAEVGGPVGFGFHGTWWKDDGKTASNGD